MPEVDQPLPAVGERRRLDLLDALEAEEPDQLRGLRVDLRVAVDVAPRVEARRMPAPAATGAGSRRSSGRGTGW